MDLSEKFLDATKVVAGEDTEQKARAAEAAAAEEARPRAAKQREEWMQERRAGMLLKSGMSEYSANLILTRAVEDNVLAGDFVITVIDPETRAEKTVTVAAILADPEAYDGWQTLDPLEPGYDGRRTVGKLLLSGEELRLKSFARGGADYRLLPKAEDRAEPRRRIRVNPHNTAPFVDACIDTLARTGMFYLSGSVLVQMKNGKFRPVTLPLLDYELSRVASAYEVKHSDEGNREVNCQPTQRLLKQIFEVIEGRLPGLAAIADHPVCRPDGSLIEAAGYDPDTEVFVLNGTAMLPEVHREYDAAVLRRAVETCMLPFLKFRFTDPVKGRTAILTSVLTAVLRPGLDKAPMVAVSSPDVGVGKGYVSQALGVIATGDLPNLKSIEKASSQEMRKQLHTDLLEQTPVIVYDNMDGLFKNEVLCSFITAPIWTDRILKESRSGGGLRNTALFITNGCNMLFPRGMSRRYILVDLVPAAGNHIFADFSFTPPGEARKHRKDIISAALTIAMAARPDTPMPGSLGSFEIWSRLVRDPIARLARDLPDLGLCDPLDLFREAVSDSADTDTAHNILSKLHETFEDTDFEATQVSELTRENPEFEGLLKEISASDPTLTPHSTGVLLGKLRNVQTLDLCLRSRKRAGKNLWRVEKREAETSIPGGRP